MSRMTYNKVLQEMKDNFPKNQYYVVKEIMKASKCEKREGIRFQKLDVNLYAPSYAFTCWI